MEKWAREYSVKAGINYDDLVNAALEMYKKNVENGTVNDYLIGREVRTFLDRLRRVYGEREGQPEVRERIKQPESSNEEVKVPSAPKKPIPKQDSLCEVLEKSEDKETYIKSMPNISADLINIILSERTYILNILYDKEICCSAVISIEEAVRSSPKYIFIHSIEFSDDKYKKLYGNVEKEIINISEKYKVNNIDRIINGQYLEQFKTMGYKEMYRNYSIRLKVEKSARRVSEYEKNLRDHVSSKCSPSFRMYPNRFKENSDSSNLYKYSTSYGRFYAKLNIKNEKCYLKLYIDENKFDRILYLKGVYYTLINDLYKNGVKIVYTLVGQKHINILKTAANVEVLKEWIWIRKSL